MLNNIYFLNNYKSKSDSLNNNNNSKDIDNNNNNKIIFIYPKDNFNKTLEFDINEEEVNNHFSVIFSKYEIIKFLKLLMNIKIFIIKIISLKN